MGYAIAQDIISTTVPTGDQNTTSATSQDITGLSFYAEANHVYEISGFIHHGCNNTGGVKFDVDLPAGSTMFLHLLAFDSSASTQVGNALTISATLTSNSYCNANNANGRLFIGGTITTGGTPGIIQFGFASGVAGQTSTIYEEGTVITAKRIS